MVLIYICDLSFSFNYEDVHVQNMCLIQSVWQKNTYMIIRDSTGFGIFVSPKIHTMLWSDTSDGIVQLTVVILSSSESDDISVLFKKDIKEF